MIDEINKAAHAYPWKTTYSVFPGPSSNTFTAWIAKQVPELELSLPFTAIGSGYVNEQPVGLSGLKRKFGRLRTDFGSFESNSRSYWSKRC